MLKYFLIVLAVLVLGATVLWGFPGVWSLLAIAPAFIIGATIAHVVRTRRERPAPGTVPLPIQRMRPAVVVLGGLFGLASAAGAMLVAWAAAAPSTIVVANELVMDAASSRVWAEVVNPYRRTVWDLWIADLEPIGKAHNPIVGAEYRSVLRLERLEVPAVQAITALDEGRSITWAITPQGGSMLDNMRETVSVVPEGEGRCRVRFEMAYDVPSVLGRVGERIAVRGSVERMTEATLERLKNVAQGLE